MFAWVITALQWVGASGVLRFLAGKTMIIGIVTLVLIPLLWNTALEWILLTASWGFDKLDAVVMPALPGGLELDWTGLLGWLGSKFRIAECIAFAAAAIAVRMLLRAVGSMIPGTRLAG